MNALADLDLATVLPLLVGLSAGALFIVVGILVSGLRNRRVVKLRQAATVEVEEIPNLRRDETDSAIPTLDRFVKRWMPRRQVLRDRLTRTGYDISIGMFLLVCLLMAAGFTYFAVLMLGLNLPLALPLGFMAGAGLPYLFISLLGAIRLDRFNKLFPEAIDIMVRGLRAGMPLGDSIQVVSQELAAPVGTEFRMIDQAVAIGQPLDVALAEAAKRVTTQEFQFFVVSLALQRETGGNLSETLANLSDILRRRRQMRLKIKAMSSEARASAWIIGMLPFVMFFAIMGVNPGYVLMLFNDPRGLVMVGIGLVSIALGMLVMQKMMRFEI